MTSSGIRAALTATIVASFSGVAVAQFPPPPPPAGSPPAAVQERWPDLPKPAQSGAPRQSPQPAQPAPPREPAVAPDTNSTRSAATPAKPSTPKPAANAVTCNGVFAKDSTHLKLAAKYDSRNVVFGEVDGPDGTRINASILFPNDPKRRLEVLWNDEASRGDTSVIAINGKSQWTAPKGLKLGTTIAALEKANGRPFKLGGFGADGLASVLGWEGGALSSLPGDCKVGVRLAIDSKASQAARSAVASDKEYLSNNPAVAAVKPSIAEILIGY
jgi:hypothetical protein